MSFETKIEATTTSSKFEVESQDAPSQRSPTRTIRLLDSARLGLTGLALLCGLTALGTAADALAVYNATHLDESYHLPLWPVDFDARPAVALVVCSAVLVVANAVSLALSRVQALRNKTLLHTTSTFACPLAGLAAALTATGLFYAVDASARVDTLQSWSCRWVAVTTSLAPHFGSVCRESRTALYLSVVLVPLEAVVAGLAAAQFVREKKVLGGGGKGAAGAAKRGPESL